MAKRLGQRLNDDLSEIDAPEAYEISATLRKDYEDASWSAPPAHFLSSFPFSVIKGSKAIKRLRCFHVTLARRMSCVVCPLDLAKRPSLCLRHGKCWCEVGQWQEILNKRMLVEIQIINSSRRQYNPGRSVLAIQSFFLSFSLRSHKIDS